MLINNVRIISQEIDERYLTAVRFINDSINLCEEFRFNCKNKSTKETVLSNIQQFKVSPEINFISYKPLMHKMFKGIYIDNEYISPELYEKNYYFQKFENAGLVKLSLNPESVMILYFSKPVENYLLAEILPCHSSKTKNYFKTRRKIFIKRNKINIDSDIPKREGYLDNKSYNKGLRMLFEFNESNRIKSFTKTMIIYN